MAFTTAASQTSSFSYLPAPISNSLSPSGLVKERERLKRWIAAADNAQNGSDAARSAVVGIIGKAGAGKTTLAIDLARECAQIAGISPIFVHARDRRLDAIARECLFRVAPEAPFYEGEDALRQFREMFSGIRSVIVIDHLTDHHHVARLAAPGSIIIVTAREPLRVPTVELREWPIDEAVAFVAQRGGVNPNDLALRQMCERVNQLPLALNLIGAFFASVPNTLPFECLRWLNDEQRRLLHMAVRDTDRLALETALAFSYHRLNVALQRVLRVLSVVPGPFDMELAGEVCDDAQHALPELVRRGLLEYDAAHQEWRWLAPVRAFARARMSNSEAVAAELRHAAAAAARAREVERRMCARQSEAALRLQLSLQHHIDAAFTRMQPDAHALPFKAARVLADLCGALRESAPLRLSPRERIAWLRAQASAHRHLQDFRGEANALGYLAALHITQNDLDAALKCYERLLEVRNELAGEPDGLDAIARVAGGPAGVKFEHLQLPGMLAQALSALGAGRRVPAQTTLPRTVPA